MARTYVPDYRKRKLSKITRSDLRANLQDQLERSQGDADKGSTLEDVSFYEGQVSALTWTLEMITQRPKEK